MMCVYKQTKWERIIKTPSILQNRQRVKYTASPSGSVSQLQSHGIGGVAYILRTQAFLLQIRNSVNISESYKSEEGIG